MHVQVEGLLWPKAPVLPGFALQEGSVRLQYVAGHRKATILSCNVPERILDRFRHYLKNEPARAWITSGVSVIDRERS
jgi:hypothetical protein